MKTRDLKELHTKSRDELIKMAVDLKIELAKLNLDLTLNKSKNTGVIKTKKKDMARILTILHEKEEK